MRIYEEIEKHFTKVQWKKCNVGWRSGKKIDIVYAHSVIKGSDHNGINVKVIITGLTLHIWMVNTHKIMSMSIIF